MTLVRTYSQGDGSIAIGDSVAQVARVVIGQIGAAGPTGPAGPKGDTGDAGPTGPKGDAGADGTDGTDGQGVPIGGTTGQVLAKTSDTDFDTEWTDQTGSGSSAWDDITGKPSTFPPTIGTSSTTALAGDTAIPSTPADIGAATAAQGALADTAVQPADLGTAASADSTDFDAAGAASTAQTTAEGYTDTAIASEVSRADAAYATAAQGGKADTAVQPTRTVNGHALSADVTVSKSDVGLGNVDNTADSAKTFTESQVTNLTSDLAAKAPLASPAMTGTPTAPTATSGTNTTQVATTAFVTTAVAAGGGEGGGSGVLLLDVDDTVPGDTAVGTIIFRQATYSGLELANSPAVILTLDETTGNFLDTSGNSRDFTPGTGVTRNLTPLIPDGGKAVSGDGSHAIATLASNGGIGVAGTLEARIKLPSGNVKGGILGVGTSSTGWALSLGNGSSSGTAGRTLMGTAAGVNYVSSGYTFPAGAGTYFVALTLSSSTWKFYVNGVLVGTGPTVAPNTPGAGMTVGSEGSAFLDSTVVVDQVAFFSTVLTSAQISADAAQPPFGALGWWDGAVIQPLGAS